MYSLSHIYIWGEGGWEPNTDPLWGQQEPSGAALSPSLFTSSVISLQWGLLASVFDSPWKDTGHPSESLFPLPLSSLVRCVWIVCSLVFHWKSFLLLDFKSCLCRVKGLSPLLGLKTHQNPPIPELKNLPISTPRIPVPKNPCMKSVSCSGLCGFLPKQRYLPLLGLSQ